MVTRLEAASLALAIIGIAANVVLGLLPAEWRAMHKRATLWGQLGGLALFGVGLHLLLFSVIPLAWEHPMIARISIVVGAVLLVGGLIGEFVRVRGQEPPSQSPPPATDQPATVPSPLAGVGMFVGGMRGGTLEVDKVEGSQTGAIFGSMDHATVRMGVVKGGLIFRPGAKPDDPPQKMN